MNILKRVFKKYYMIKTKDDFKADIYSDIAISNYYHGPINRLKTEKMRYLVSAIIYLVIPIGIYLLADISPKDSFISQKLSDPSGNLLAELYGGYFFLIISLRLQKSTEKKIGSLHNELERIESDRKYQRMISFLNKGTNYNVSLDDFTHEDGSNLIYNISPSKDPDNNPVFDDDGISKHYIVKVNSIAFSSPLKDDRKYDYLASPISPGEYYFIAFVDNKWGFFDVLERRDHIPFSWSGKNGQVRSVPYANDIMDVLAGYTKVLSFIYDLETGRRSQSGDTATIYKNNKGQYFLTPKHKSHPKRIFITSPEHDFSEENLYIHIYQAYGCFLNKSVLKTFKKTLGEELSKKGIKLDKLKFYEAKKFIGL